MNFNITVRVIKIKTINFKTDTYTDVVFFLSFSPFLFTFQYSLYGCANGSADINYNDYAFEIE